MPCQFSKDFVPRGPHKARVQSPKTGFGDLRFSGSGAEVLLRSGTKITSCSLTAGGLFLELSKIAEKIHNGGKIFKKHGFIHLKNTQFSHFFPDNSAGIGAAGLKFRVLIFQTHSNKKEID